ncbi:MAG TPA: hypothetical protein VJP04_03790 [Terriglobales bacterium]|nr:hypothetical protein [Terriglobales bacterium]
MRHMVPYPWAGPILQFRCTHCDWSFYIEHVQRQGVRQQERDKATAWFEAHSCDEFRRREWRPTTRSAR